MANRRVALAEAVGDVNNNLNAGYRDDCGVLSSFVADGGQVERFVVVSACGEHRVIVQSRCLGLTGTDIHIYIHTYKRGTTTHHNYLPHVSARQSLQLCEEKFAESAHCCHTA